jgi:hypothetical protein
MSLMRPLATLALQVGWPMALAAAALMAAMWFVLQPLLGAWSAAWRHGSALALLYALGVAACLLAEYALFVALVVAVALNLRRPRPRR